MDWLAGVLQYINSAMSGILWGPPMLMAFLSVGAMFTWRLGFFQVTRFRLWIDRTLFSLFRGQGRARSTEHGISQFQALTTALAGTVGTGNIVGVASAIALGGPGAVFWMWLSAALGMMTSFAEKTLAIKYRYKNAKGEWIGGAMAYIERGLGSKFLAVLFACLLILASFGIGNITQVNSISSALDSGFGVNSAITGAVTAILIGVVIMGGIKRIGRFTEALMPVLVCAYVFVAIVCVLAFIDRLPGAMSMIISEAFKPRAAVSGAAGYGIMTAMRMGISRGVYSNEAGLGSSVTAHSAADVKEPCEQGMWGVFEVFVDTIIMCTLTALVILTSGAYDMNASAVILAEGGSVLEGAALTMDAMARTLGGLSRYIIAISLALFAFSTLIGWSYYGECGTKYVFGERAVPLYRIIFTIFVFIGAVSNLESVWEISDIFNALMAVPNLIALVFLSGEVVKLKNGYFSK